MINMSTFHVFISLFLIFLLVLPSLTKDCAKEGSSRSPSLKIKKDILCKYDKEFRPRRNQKQTVNVTVRLIPKYLDDVSIENTVDIQNWLGVAWLDEFLVWKPSDYNSIKSIHLSSSDIWTPDLKLYEKGNKNQDTVFDSDDCLVQYNGLVSCVLENEHKSYCREDLVQWPMDSRTCDVVYTMGIYNSSEVQFRKGMKQLLLATLQENYKWKLINSSSQISDRKMFGQKYQQLKFTFVLQRNSVKTISLLLIPAMSLITMTLAPLWMKPDTNERFCLIAADILSHILFIQHIGWIAPLISNSIPSTVTFFRDSLGLAIVVLIEMTLIKSMLSKCSASPVWLVNPCKFVANGIIGKGMLLEEIQEVKEEEEDMQNDNKEVKIKKQFKEKILIISVLDRILFIILFIVYFTLIICIIPF